MPIQGTTEAASTDTVTTVLSSEETTLKTSHSPSGGVTTSPTQETTLVTTTSGYGQVNKITSTVSSAMMNTSPEVSRDQTEEYTSMNHDSTIENTSEISSILYVDDATDTYSTSREELKVSTGSPALTDMPPVWQTKDRILPAPSPIQLAMDDNGISMTQSTYIIAYSNFKSH